jgi:hypothetical protein
MPRTETPAPTIPMYPTRRDWDDLAWDIAIEVEAFAKRMGQYAALINENSSASVESRRFLEGVEARTREALSDELGELQSCCWNAAEEVAA